MAREQGQKFVAQNKKARHDYPIDDTYEAGLVLVGTEVKSLRQGRASLVDGFAEIDGDEAWLLNVHISPYSHEGSAHHEERRQRKLLLHRHEIRKLTGKVAEKGLTLVPLTTRSVPISSKNSIRPIARSAMHTSSQPSTPRRRLRLGRKSSASRLHCTWPKPLSKHLNQILRPLTRKRMSSRKN